MKKKLAGLGVGALIVGVASAQYLPKTPKEAVTWIDAGMYFVSQAGMPGVVLVLMISLGAVIYYEEFVKIPKLHEHYNKELDDAREEIKDQNKDALQYRDDIMKRLEKLLTDGTVASTKLEGILVQVLDFLKSRKKGKTNNGVS